MSATNNTYFLLLTLPKPDSQAEHYAPCFNVGVEAVGLFLEHVGHLCHLPRVNFVNPTWANGVCPTREGLTIARTPTLDILVSPIGHSKALQLEDHTASVVV